MAEQRVGESAAQGRLVTGQSLVDRFSTWLRERNLPVTTQRLAIAEFVFASDRQLSAEEIAGGLGAHGDRVGTATVYRTLDVLVESGLVIERDLGEGFLRFVTAGDEPAHDHLRCTSCGRVETFHDDGVEGLAERIAVQHGFDAGRPRLVIHGVCRECRAGCDVRAGVAT